MQAMQGFKSSCCAHSDQTIHDRSVCSMYQGSPYLPSLRTNCARSNQVSISALQTSDYCCRPNRYPSQACLSPGSLNMREHGLLSPPSSAPIVKCIVNLKTSVHSRLTPSPSVRYPAGHLGPAQYTSYTSTPHIISIPAF